MNDIRQRTITLTLSENHWLRIRASLLCSAEDLASVESDQEAQYHHTYTLVRDGLAPWLD